jgi:hypothetical protein
VLVVFYLFHALYDEGLIFVVKMEKIGFL